MLDGDSQIQHLNGVPWFEATVPPTVHVCVVQTQGFSGLHQYFRCACGAISEYRGRTPLHWDERNTRVAAKKHHWWSRNH